MNIILLSGGSGKRLWPLSNDVRSKQFVKLFKDENGEYESMVQRVYRQITAVDQDATVTIATSKSQASWVILNLSVSSLAEEIHFLQSRLQQHISMMRCMYHGKKAWQSAQ